MYDGWRETHEQLYLRPIWNFDIGHGGRSELLRLQRRIDEYQGRKHGGGEYGKTGRVVNRLKNKVRWIKG